MTGVGIYIVILVQNLKNLDRVIEKIREDLPDDLKVTHGKGTLFDPEIETWPVLEPLMQFRSDLNRQINIIRSYGITNPPSQD